MMEEVWKPVVGFEYIYEVSNHGIVRNIINGRVRKPHTTHNGYLAISIDIKSKGIRTHLYIHRIVAEAFIPNLENKPCVNHINEDKHDNCVENLEWCTHYENNHHNDLEARNLKKRLVPVARVTWNGDILQEFESVKAAAIAENVQSHCILDWINLKKRCSRGYTFKYLAKKRTK